MQEYVQKSTSTTLPRSCWAVSGGLLSQPVAPSSAGRVPSTGSGASAPVLAPAIIIGGAAGCAPGTASSRLCSMRAVLTVDRRVSRPVSQPRPIATTASSAATPSTLRRTSPRPSRACIARNTRPPIHTASASAVIAPSA
ncbi:hypothetical protein G6F61_014381 [Rhizopus arrhizus]|nr:hypothetical protein G6F61_014381 [Rhizopus arrhizus]KAG1391108.1 hypothetical protein G6F58_012789 [Rhizopus delemar]